MRVVISPPTAADEAAFTEAMRRSRKLHGRWGGGPTTPEEYAVYLAKAAEERRRYFFARLRDGGEIVGFLNLGEIIRGSLHQAFLGYGAVAGHEGRGLMSEGMQLVLREAFGPLSCTASRRTSSRATRRRSRSRSATASGSRASRRAT